MKVYAIVVFILIIFMNLIFRYLVNTNRMKPNKVSMFFYYDDESFSKSWPKIEEKGRIRYALKSIITSTVTAAIIEVFILLDSHRMFGYEQSSILFVLLLMVVIIGLKDYLIGWDMNQKRYIQLKEKELVESDKMNNDNNTKGQL